LLREEGVGRGVYIAVETLRVFFKFMYNVSGDEKWAELLDKVKTRRRPMF